MKPRRRGLGERYPDKGASSAEALGKCDGDVVGHVSLKVVYGCSQSV